MDYEELLNCVERHITCNEKSCLRKKGRKFLCRYKAPWKLCNKSKLYVDENGENKYEPRRNDDRLNTHNRETLMMWRPNIDWKHVLSKCVVINYIAKYAAKAEKGSETFHDMLIRVSNIENPNEPTTHAYRRLLCETIVDRDIGAQETCHMLLELPLCESSHQFVVLNVGMKVYKQVQANTYNAENNNSLINAYTKRAIDM